MRKYLIGVLIVFFTIGIGTIAAAQDSPRKAERPSADIQGRSGDTQVDIQVQQKGEEGKRGVRDRDIDRGRPGPEGPAGAPGPRGPAGDPGPGGGTILGIDSTVALLVGLAILAVVIVAIVAASRGGGREV